MRLTKWSRWTAVLAALAIISGCQPIVWQRESAKKPKRISSNESAPSASEIAFRNSIGAQSYYEGMQPLVVRGYGLVVGLGKNGSRECPKPVFEKLVRNMYRHRRPQGKMINNDQTSPEKMITDLDTAVVVVQGQIPAAAVTGTHFDVTVSAFPGTRTKSLRGGTLLVSELEVYQRNAEGKALSSRPLARAFGPVFLNPFSSEGSATTASELRGAILGGGIAKEDRKVRLVLTRPSYKAARSIQERINNFFPGVRKIADAKSPSFIQLHIPSEYAHETSHFLGLVRSIYMSQDPTFAGAKARQLGKAMLAPTAPHPQISLALEGLGRDALPVLAELYSHNQEYVSFHAAVAGLRLNDYIAGDTMAMIATRSESLFRYQAIRALGQASGMANTAIALRQLVFDSDPRIRIAAYEALASRNDRSIVRSKLAGNAFQIDRVESGEPSFVYAKRTGHRRIVLFGKNLQCAPPVFYRSTDGSLTMTAEKNADSLTLLRRVNETGSVSPPVEAPFDLQPLIELLGNNADLDLQGRVTGLGLDYGAVVQAIYELCKSNGNQLQFILEQPNASELFGPTRPTGRPESEL